MLSLPNVYNIKQLTVIYYNGEGYSRKLQNYKLQAVVELLNGATVEELSYKFDVPVSEINTWCEEFVQCEPFGFERHPKSMDKKVLRGKIGQMELVLDLFKKKNAIMKILRNKDWENTVLEIADPFASNESDESENTENPNASENPVDSKNSNAPSSGLNAPTED